jgi:hypothetical protein
VYWKGIGVFGEDKGFHSVTHPSPSLRAFLQRWYNLHLYFICQRRESSQKGLYFTQSICFWRFMPKGEKVLAQSKRTAPPPNFKKSFFNWYDFSNWYLMVFKKGESNIFKILILKPSWTLRGGIYQGGVLFKSKEKHLKQGEKISILENASQSLIHLPLTICKRTLKRIYNRICKNKTCGASVVQNVRNEETIHAYLMSSYIGSIPSNLCTYIMQTSSIMHFYICFGLCW